VVEAEEHQEVVREVNAEDVAKGKEEELAITVTEQLNTRDCVQPSACTSLNMVAMLFSPLRAPFGVTDFLGP
jgi:gamma-glutamyl phosphate reductase